MWLATRLPRLFRPAARNADYTATVTIHPSPGNTATPAERRASVRRWGHPVEVLFWARHAGGDALRGWVLNRSGGGLGLKVAEPLAHGTVLELRPAITPKASPWILVEVKGSYERAGCRILRCQFLGTPDPDVLALLG